MIFIAVAALAVLLILIIAVNKLGKQQGRRSADGDVLSVTEGTSNGGTADASGTTSHHHPITHDTGPHHAGHSDAGGSFGHGGDFGGGFDGGGHGGH